MAVLWEIEHDRTGLNNIVQAETYREMIDNLKRIGFHSIVNPDHETDYHIDFMTATRSNGETYTASELHRPLPGSIRDLPLLEQWPDHSKIKTEKEKAAALAAAAAAVIDTTPGHLPERALDELETALNEFTAPPPPPIWKKNEDPAPRVSVSFKCDRACLEDLEEYFRGNNSLNIHTGPHTGFYVRNISQVSINEKDSE